MDLGEAKADKIIQFLKLHIYEIPPSIRPDLDLFLQRDMNKKATAIGNNTANEEGQQIYIQLIWPSSGSSKVAP
jgi:hypothetical protein